MGISDIAKNLKDNALDGIKNNAKEAVKDAGKDFVGNLVEGVLEDFGIDSDNGLFGIDSHNNLKKFLDQISDSHNEGVAIKQPDPLNTFEIKFRFYPSVNLNPKKKSGGLVGKAINTLTNAAKDTVRSTLNKATGGLLGALTNNVIIMEEHGNHQTIKSVSENHTFLEYLAKANLLCGNENTWLGGTGDSPVPLEIDMTYFVQKMTIPHLKFQTEEDTVEYFGKFPINGRYVEPDNHTLTLNILNTKVPVLERIFYPWMREVTLPYWSYSTQPYTTATITVDLGSHTDLKYVFIGCRPSDIELYSPDHGMPSGMERQVQFIFDYMFVKSKLSTTESLTSKGIGIVSKLIKL